MTRPIGLGVLLTLLAAVSSARATEIVLSGRVTDSAGKARPAADLSLLPALDAYQQMKIQLSGGGPEAIARARTDVQGYYEMTAPGAGLYVLRVASAGFLPVEFALSPLLEPVELPDATLVPDAGLAIRVVEAKDAPIAGAIVHATSSNPASRRGRSAGAAWKPAPRWAVTKPDGTTRLPRGEDERITLTASAPGRIVLERANVRGTSATLQLAAGTPRSIEVRSNDKTPVAGAVVSTDAADHPLGITDEQGSLRIPLAKGASLRVAVRAEDGRVARGSVPPAAAPETAPRRFVLPPMVPLTGRVLDAQTRRAIPDALVWRDSEPGGAVRTDPSGAYSLRAADGGSFGVIAGATGYLPANPIEARASAADPSGPTLALRAAAAIEGTVVNGDGAPVAGAKIGLEERRPEGMFIMRMGAGAGGPATVSSSRGRFRLGPVDPDSSYDLTARATGFAPATREIAGLEARKTLRGIRIDLDRGQTIGGRVVDGDGQPIAGADASARSSPRKGGPGGLMLGERGGGAEPERFVTDGEGRFRIRGLRPGSYEVLLARRGFARKTVAGVDVRSGEGATDLGDVVLAPGERVPGRAIDPQGRPIEGVEVALQQGEMRLAMGMHGLAGSGRPPEAVTAPDGTFLVEDLHRGDAIELNLTRRGYAPARASVARVPPDAPIEITMQPASIVSGSVIDQDRKPLPGATVTLRRSRTGGIGGAVFKMLSQDNATADDQGRFVFDDVEPGTISLSAVAPGRREAKIDSVEVPAGEDLSGIELSLPPGAVIVGRVIAPDGRPAIGAEVRVVAEESPIARFRGPGSDGDGRYRLDGLEPGPVSIEATHADYVRVVKDVDAKPGTNQVNLELGGGSEVSGLVVDSEGTPVAGAWVRLAAAGREWGGPETTSGADGKFSVKGATDGEYKLWAGKSGYATSRGEVAARVEGAPVRDLSVRLDRGAAIAGRVIGLDPERLPQVSIRAARGSGFGGLQGVAPDRQGRYRFDNLSAGRWNVIASLEATGQQTRGEITLEPGAAEATLDLEFAKGLTLSGTAVHGGSAVSGASLYVQGTNVEHSGWSRTGADGAFSIGGLLPGSYRLELRQWETGLGYTETFEVTSDREIVLEIPTARIDGRVLDSADRQPLPGATVSVSPANPVPGSRFGGLDERAATTDQEGRFRVPDLADGAWKVSVSKSGYAARIVDLVVRSGRGPDDVRVELDPTEGLTLQVKLPDGRVPAEVTVAVLDGGGRAMTRGTYATGENGRVRLSSVSAGTWPVVVGAAGAGTVEVRATAPGEAVPVVLPPACALKIDLPDLAASGMPATATIRDPGGRPFIGLDWTGDPVVEWRVARGRLELDDLPPGGWAVELKTADGRSRNGRAGTAPGSPGLVTFDPAP